MLLSKDASCCSHLLNFGGFNIMYASIWLLMIPFFLCYGHCHYFSLLLSCIFSNSYTVPACMLLSPRGTMAVILTYLLHWKYIFVCYSLSVVVLWFPFFGRVIVFFICYSKSEKQRFGSLRLFQFLSLVCFDKWWIHLSSIEIPVTALAFQRYLTFMVCT